METRKTNTNAKTPTALKLFLIILSIVFITDISTNIITNLFNLSIFSESVMGGILIILFAYPALYIFIFKPLTVEISERKRIEKLKDDFIGTVSHELRTPLSITKEGISLVLDNVPGPINEQQARILTVSKNNVDRLARIINSLLDISRIESGKVGVRREAFDITAVVRQVIGSFESKLKDKGLSIRMDIPKVELIIHGDNDAIAQVLINLVSNSLKFTERGEINVSVNDKGDFVEISVSDTGMGISGDNLPSLFEKFQQFGRTDGPGEKGTGLGLAIAKGIVTAHNGRIWAESSLGEGTKITFILPKEI